MGEVREEAKQRGGDRRRIGEGREEAKQRGGDRRRIGEGREEGRKLNREEATEGELGKNLYYSAGLYRSGGIDLVYPEA